jgi:hypothetical protein
VNEERERDELSQEELDSLLGEELPQREALSVLRVPFLGNAPVESADAVEPTEPVVPDE